MIEQLLENVVVRLELLEDIVARLELLEDIIARFDKVLFALEYAYFLFKVGLALLGIYALYRLFRYLIGFNRV